MNLHIFNPEHELAMASNLQNFTAPHAARKLRAGLGFIAALWADNGDYVLVEDADYADKAYRKMLTKTDFGAKDIVFIGKGDIIPIMPDKVDVWGWDTAVRNTLLRRGIDRNLMPTLEQIDELRRLAHRATTKKLLRRLRTIDGTVGSVKVALTLKSVLHSLADQHCIVVKAPWSSSGRGVRFIDDKPSKSVAGWMENVIDSQGCLVVEPYYKKVKDFGMEFYSDGHGHVRYLGLSLFHTVNGAYSGNILATEQAKLKMISRYASEEKLMEIRNALCRELGSLYKGRYEGLFGVDMMIVANDSREGFLIHPCVEINLRRTMGHVALLLSPSDDDIRQVMSIDIDDNFLLKIQTL